jgi:hypothetical protein
MKQAERPVTRRGHWPMTRPTLMEVSARRALHDGSSTVFRHCTEGLALGRKHCGVRAWLSVASFTSANDSMPCWRNWRCSSASVSRCRRRLRCCTSPCRTRGSGGGSTKRDAQRQDADRNFKPSPQGSLVRVGGLVQAAPKAQVRLQPALPQAGPGKPGAHRPTPPLLPTAGACGRGTARGSLSSARRVANQ